MYCKCCTASARSSTCLRMLCHMRVPKPAVENKRESWGQKDRRAEVTEQGIVGIEKTDGIPCAVTSSLLEPQGRTWLSRLWSDTAKR